MQRGRLLESGPEARCPYSQGRGTVTERGRKVLRGRREAPGSRLVVQGQQNHSISCDLG